MMHILKEQLKKICLTFQKGDKKSVLFAIDTKDHFLFSFSFFLCCNLNVEY